MSAKETIAGNNLKLSGVDVVVFPQMSFYLKCGCIEH